MLKIQSTSPVSMRNIKQFYLSFWLFSHNMQEMFINLISSHNLPSAFLTLIGCLILFCWCLQHWVSSQAWFMSFQTFSPDIEVVRSWNFHALGCKYFANTLTEQVKCCHRATNSIFFPIYFYVYIYNSFFFLNCLYDFAPLFSLTFFVRKWECVLKIFRNGNSSGC